jgi:hypothetical protein
MRWRWVIARAGGLVRKHRVATLRAKIRKLEDGGVPPERGELRNEKFGGWSWQASPACRINQPVARVDRGD